MYTLCTYDDTLNHKSQFRVQYQVSESDSPTLCLAPALPHYTHTQSSPLGGGSDSSRCRLPGLEAKLVSNSYVVVHT